MIKAKCLEITGCIDRGIVNICEYFAINVSIAILMQINPVDLYQNHLDSVTL